MQTVLTCMVVGLGRSVFSELKNSYFGMPSFFIY
jgi:hypothetical protein